MLDHSIVSFALLHFIMIMEGGGWSWMSACIVQHGGHTPLNELLVKVDNEPLVGRLLTPRRPRLADRRSIWTFGYAKAGKIRNRQNQKQKTTEIFQGNQIFTT